MECHFSVLINDWSTYPPQGNPPPPETMVFHKALLRKANGCSLMVARVFCQN